MGLSGVSRAGAAKLLHTFQVGLEAVKSNSDGSRESQGNIPLESRFLTGLHKGYKGFLSSTQTFRAWPPAMLTY